MKPIERLYNAIFGEEPKPVNITALQEALRPFATLARMALKFPEVFESAFVPKLSEQTAKIALEMADVVRGNNSMGLKIKEHTDPSEACWCVAGNPEEFATKEEAEEFAKTVEGENDVWHFDGKYYEIYSDEHDVEFPMPYSWVRAVAFIYAATRPPLFSENYDYDA